MRLLVGLITAKGFMSNADIMGGVEKIVIGPPNPAFYTTRQEYPHLHPGMANCFEVHEDKGWSRANALLFVLGPIMSLDIVKEFKEM
eukprot:13000669-Alexandrium_andersonii.AAC.1